MKATAVYSSLLMLVLIGVWVAFDKFAAPGAGEKAGSLRQLAEEPFKSLEYKYDVQALHEQWKRDLVWDDARDAEIRAIHQEHVELHNRHLQAAQPHAVGVEQHRQKFVQSLSEGNPNEEVSCFIGYKTLTGRQETIRSALAYQSPHARHDFDDVNVIAVTLPKDQLRSLLDKSDHIEFVEQDKKIYPKRSRSRNRRLIDGGPITSVDLATRQVTPYGIKHAQGGIQRALPSSKGLENSCAKSASFKIALIDFGIGLGHPDLPCTTVNAPNCIGR